MLKKWAWFVSETAEVPVKRVTLGFQGIEPLFIQAIEHVGRPKRTKTIDGKRKQLPISDEEYASITNVFNVASACTAVCEKSHWSSTAMFFAWIFEKMGYQKVHQKNNAAASKYIIDTITTQIIQDGIIDDSYSLFSVSDYNEFWEQSEAYSVVLDMMFAAATANTFQHINRIEYYDAFGEMLAYVPSNTTADIRFLHDKVALLQAYISEIQKANDQ